MPATTGFCSSTADGTFESAVSGTFVPALPGTFESDTGGTFNPLLSDDIKEQLDIVFLYVKNCYEPRDFSFLQETN